MKKIIETCRDVVFGLVGIVFIILFWTGTVSLLCKSKYYQVFFFVPNLIEGYEVCAAKLFSKDKNTSTFENKDDTYNKVNLLDSNNVKFIDNYIFGKISVLSSDSVNSRMEYAKKIYLNLSDEDRVLFKKYALYSKTLYIEEQKCFLEQIKNASDKKNPEFVLCDACLPIIDTICNIINYDARRFQLKNSHLIMEKMFYDNFKNVELNDVNLRFIDKALKEQWKEVEFRYKVVFQ